MTDRVRFFGVAAALLVSGLVVGAQSGCGRSPLRGGGGGGQSCTPSCEEICSALDAGCPKLASQSCVGQCRSEPRPTSILCLQQLVCQGAALSCGDVQTCFINPRVADLVISTFSATSPRNGELSWQAKVCNLGNGPSVPTRLHFYRNRTSAPSAGQLGQESVAIPALQSNSCQTVLTAATGLPAGSYRSYAYIDPEGVAVETNEQNNVAGPAVVNVGGSGGQPDYVITELRGVPSSSVGYIDYTITLCNHGGLDPQTTLVELYANRKSTPLAGTSDRMLYASMLLPSQCTKLNAHVLVNAKDSVSSWARVDPQDLVKESNEQNNLVGPVTIKLGKPLPDLEISKAAVQAIGGTTARYTATICNVGSVVSSYTDLGLYWDRKGPPQPFEWPDQVSDVPALAPGNCITRTLTAVLKAGNYRSALYVDRKGVVTESNEQNNVYWPLEVNLGSAPADLELSKLEVFPQGSSGATYLATVCNKGTAPTNMPTTVDFFDNRSQPPGFGTPANRSETVPPLGGGQCTGVKVFAPLTPGNYSAWAYVNRKQSVPEITWGNNIAGPVPFYLGSTNLPDLTVTALTASPQGQNVQFSANVCNYGVDALTNAALDFYWDLPQAPSVTVVPNRTQVVPVLKAKQCVQVQALEPRPVGTFTAWAWINRKGTIIESNFNNNQLSTKYTVGSGSQPDLIVNVLLAGLDATGGISYTAELCNKGGQSSTAAWVHIFYDLPQAPTPAMAGQADDKTAIGPLAPGGCMKVTFSAGLLAPGPHLSWVYVDILQTVVESNENNNTKSALVLVPGGQPDLSIKTFDAKPSATGATAYSMEVCNNGTSASPASTVRLYFDRATAPPLNVPGDQDHAVGALAVGSCQTISALATLQSGTFSSWAQVDPDNSIAESNETNNVSGPLAVIVGTPADACDQACKELVSPCSMLPASQEASCISNCQASTQTKIDCAWQATLLGQCSAIVQCLFGP